MANKFETERQALFALCDGNGVIDWGTALAWLVDGARNAGQEQKGLETAKTIVSARARINPFHFQEDSKS